MHHPRPCGPQLRQHLLHLQLMLTIHPVPLNIHQLILIIQLMLQEVYLLLLCRQLILVDLLQRLNLKRWIGVVMGKFRTCGTVWVVVGVVEVLLVAVLEADTALLQETQLLLSENPRGDVVLAHEALIVVA